MLVLIVAGESVFLLPFVVARIFRPTFLEVFNLTNFELGAAFSVYGLVAMVSYFFGGPLADKYSAKHLMTIALVTTSSGGYVFIMHPNIPTLSLLYGFWGMTSILLFWAALIRATREWGGHSRQGRAYGFLDGGRGLFAALLATISVAVFAQLLPAEVDSASLADKTKALHQIIIMYTVLILAIAVLVWMIIPKQAKPALKTTNKKWSLEGMKIVTRMPTVWLQAVMIVCAYVGYKATDDFSLYAYDSFGYDDVEAARIGTISFWIRPFAAIIAGMIADKIRSSQVMIYSFLFLILGSVVMSTGWIKGHMYVFFVITIVCASIGIYALRGVYFALFNEANVPVAFTGTAVGIVSFLGFTPDIFMGPLMGFLIDRSPGALGHQHVFAMLAVFGAIGLMAAVAFQRHIKEGAKK